MPLGAHAKYTDIALGQGLFCGLLEDGTTDCYSTFFREPGILNGDSALTFTELEAAGYTICGITDTQEVACWGDDIEGIIDPPAFDFPVVKMSMSRSGYYACAVDSGTNVKCWGQTSHGQATPANGAVGFVDVTTMFSHACGLGSDGSVSCWGIVSAFGDDSPASSIVPSDVTDLVSIEFTEAVHCGIRSTGNALCWKPTGERVAEFNNGPYKQLMPYGRSNRAGGVCAETLNGEVDCTDVLSLEDLGSTLATIERISSTFVAVDNGAASSVCGYTAENRLECPVTATTSSSRDQRLIDLVNGELSMPELVISNAVYYGFGVEIFYNSPSLNAYNLGLNYDLDVYRDGEFLVRTDNATSYLDQTVEENRDYTYSIQAVHTFGQISDLSNSISVRTSTTESDITNNPQSARPNEPAGLRAEVYWFDVELFWDRDFSGNVRNYEIRRNGELVATTRGTSWYDASTADGGRYVYDVIAVAEDNSILGFRSVPVEIGTAVCQ